MNCCDTDFSAAGFPAAAGSINQRPSVELPQPVAAEHQPLRAQFLSLEYEAVQDRRYRSYWCEHVQEHAGEACKGEERSPLSVTSHISHRH